MRFFFTKKFKTKDDFLKKSYLLEIVLNLELRRVS